MCLDLGTVKKLSKELNGVVAFKLFDVGRFNCHPPEAITGWAFEHDGSHTGTSDKFYKLNTVYKAIESVVYVDAYGNPEGENYISGFHAYRDLKGAIKNLHKEEAFVPAVFKVLLNGVHTEGLQYGNKTFVAREMIILEEVKL